MFFMAGMIVVVSVVVDMVVVFALPFSVSGSRLQQGASQSIGDQVYSFCIFLLVDVVRNMGR